MQTSNFLLFQNENQVIINAPLSSPLVHDHDQVIICSTPLPHWDQKWSIC